jgi:hypothetical protein
MQLGAVLLWNSNQVQTVYVKFNKIFRGQVIA